MADAAISALVTRLEAVAKRLESVEGQLAAGGAPAAAAAGGVAAGAGDDAGADKPFVAAFQALIDEHVTPLTASKITASDPQVTEAVQGFADAVAAQLAFLKVAAQAKKPDAGTLQELIKPTADKMGEVGTLFEKHRGHKMSNHLQTISEGIQALGWVVVEPTPGPYVGDMRGGSEFYSNRILKEFKDKDEDQMAWVKSFNGFLKELQVYIKSHHTTGVVWNAQGGDAKDFAGAAAAPAAAPGGGPPPPPGPGPPPPPAPAPAPAADAGADMSGVFAALNKGADITKGLKKVDKSQMTHKNPELRAGGTVAADAIKKPKAAAKKPTYGARAGAVKPAKFGLSGTKWEVEHQDGNRGIVIDQTEVKHTVYLYQCKNTTVQVKGKVNAIIIDSCDKTAVVFDNAIASVDIINCRSIEVQVTGSVPSFSIDKCSSILVHLSKEAKGAEIVTSKCDSVNVSFPVEGKQDPIECPVPEQFKTTVVNDQLETDQIRHE